MAHRDDFYASKTRTLYVLWTVTVIDGLEILFCIAEALKSFIVFWDQFGVLIYSWWSMLGIITSGSGIYAIKKNNPEVLGKNAMYFLYSALVKGILIMISLKSASFGPDFEIVIFYASTGPLLFKIVRFIQNFFPMPITVAHLFVLLSLLGVGTQLKHLRNAMLKRNAHIELELEENGGIRTMG